MQRIDTHNNTNGKLSNRSIAITEHEQGAWWQVDLGGQKNIKQIIIYNRTDCCINRLSNYHQLLSQYKWLNQRQQLALQRWFQFLY
jgi:hypothetical protein